MAFRQITLTTSGINPVTFDRGIGSPDWYARGTSADKRPNGRTGVSVLKVAGPASDPYFTVVVNAAKVTVTELAIFEKIWTEQQAVPTLSVILKDEHEEVPIEQSTWNSRAVVTGSTYAVPNTGGLERCFVEYPVFLVYEPEADKKYLGNGWYSLSFTAEEVS